MKFVHILLLGSMAVNVILLVILQTAIGGNGNLRGDSHSQHETGAHSPMHSLQPPPRASAYKPKLMPHAPSTPLQPPALPPAPTPTAYAPTSPLPSGAPPAVPAPGPPAPPAPPAAGTPDWAKPAAPLPPPTRSLQFRSPDAPLVNPLLRHLGGHNADSLWDRLLASHPDPRNAFVIEVGAHDGNQALDAGKMGFQVITYEPSPESARGIRRNFDKHRNPRNVKLVEAAATNYTGTIMMNAVGSTGDHIGVNTGEINKAYLTNKHTEVQAVMVDDMVLSLDKGVYMVKIDVQGHEVLVLEGMRKALEQRRVLYVMLEFWPRAIKTTSHRTGYEALKLLASYGYEIYDTKVHHRRKRKEPNNSPPGTQRKNDFFRPTALKAASGWYEDMDNIYRDTFGCKTDMLAVAPVTDEQLKMF